LISCVALALNLFGDLVEREPLKELTTFLGIVALAGTELAQESNSISSPHLLNEQMDRLPVDFA